MAASTASAPTTKSKMATGRAARSRIGATTIRLTPTDRAHIEAIQSAGWARNGSQAIAFALKFTAEKVAA